MKTPDTINGKTPEEIKKGLMCYRGKHPFAIGHCPSGCPYEQCGTSCREMMNTDALAYIQQLETRLAQVERERDAAVYDLEMAVNKCSSISADCEFCKDKGKPVCEKCSFEWRGVCPENTKEAEE